MDGEDWRARPGSLGRDSSQRERRYDFFISHTSEDKAAVARPLAQALRSKGFDVWYDEFELRVGDSLSQSIDHGLRTSEFGIVVLSPAFFKRQWPQRELRGLVTQELRGAAKILPVWHGVTVDQVADWSPPLADVKAADTKHGLERVVDDLISSVGPRELHRRIQGGWFRGNHPGRVHNGSLRLPRAFLNKFDDLAMVTSVVGTSVRVYPLAVWVDVEAKLAHMPIEHPARVRFMNRVNFYGTVQEIRPTGHVRFDEPLRTHAGLDDDVDVDVLGQYNFVEIWNHSKFSEQLQRDPFTDDDARILADFGI